MQTYKGPPLRLTSGFSEGTSLLPSSNPGPQPHVRQSRETMIDDVSPEKEEPKIRIHQFLQRCGLQLAPPLGPGGWARGHRWSPVEPWPREEPRTQDSDANPWGLNPPPNPSLSHIYCISLNILICKLEVTLARTLRKRGGG